MPATTIYYHFITITERESTAYVLATAGLSREKNAIRKRKHKSSEKKDKYNNNTRLFVLFYSL